jgi:hypothetical protein
MLCSPGREAPTGDRPISIEAVPDGEDVVAHGPEGLPLRGEPSLVSPHSPDNEDQAKASSFLIN